MKLLLTTCLLALSVTGLRGEPRTKISVYYETLCGDSKRFIANQLRPLTRSPIGKYVDVDLIPYGKASTRENRDGDYEFTCQHGEMECRGNKEHACALKHMEKSDAVQFIACTMATSYPPDAGKDCASKLDLDYSSISSCKKSSEGSELLAKYGRKTHGISPKLHFVPWITFDGKYDEERMDRSLYSLRDVVCEIIGDDTCAKTENRGSRRARRKRTVQKTNL